MKSKLKYVLIVLASVGAAFGAYAEIPVEASEQCSKYQDGKSHYQLAVCVRDVKQRLNEQRQAEQYEAERQARYENSPAHGEMSSQRCMLDKAPSVINELALVGVISECQRYRSYGRERKPDRFFGFDTAKECFADRGGKTHSKTASALIANACLTLYPGALH